MAASCGYEFQVKHFGFVEVKPEDFYSSQWFKSKVAFVLYRIFMFLYCLIWSINTTIVLVMYYPDYYAYLSDWGEWSLVFHFGVHLAVAIYGWATGHKSTGVESGCCPGASRCKDNLRWFHRFAWVVSTAVISINYIITIIYWAFLGDLPVVSAAVNIHQHAMNSVLMTLDLFISRVPVRYLHFIYVSLYGVVYVLFTAILHGAKVKSVYYANLLDWKNSPGLSTGVSLGLIFVGSAIIHLVPFGFYHLRTFIAREGGCAQKRGDAVLDDRNFREGQDNPVFAMATSDGNL